MVLAESGLPQWQVVATDISTKALARTAEARYGTHELAGLSPERRDRYLVPVAGASDAWEVAPSLRKKVLAFRHNLAADPPPLPAGRCHVVFCRNVLIYFGHDDVVAFLNSLAAWLPPGAHLFLGYSESLWLVSERFHLVRLGDAFVYRNGPAPGAAATRQASAKGAARPAGATPQSPTAEVSPPPRPASAAARPASAAARAAGAARAPSPVPRLEPNEAGLLAEGEAAMGAGDYAGAVIAFRKAAFLDPDQPVAHLSLGLALEATGDRAAAQRAFTAARAAVDRGDTAAIETTLEGYRLDEFTRLLDLKTGTA
jgi:chemotaxis protein methyltransferase CheR